jgi:membrane associated rhomboid family serine protease
VDDRLWSDPDEAVEVLTTMIYLVLFLDFLLSLVFLIPVKDDRGRYRSFSYMTVGLILLNTMIHVVFYWFLPQWLGSDEVWFDLAQQMLLVPADVINGEGLGALSMLTSAFLHGSWPHLIGNMLYLFFFGRKLEDVMGPAKFGLFYLVCVFVSSIGSVLGRIALPLTQGKMPGLGASGAVMGVVGAYLFLYHEQRIHTWPMLFGFIPVPFTLRMPAWVFIIQTIARDVTRGWLEQQAQAQGQIYSLVGSSAHLGGIIAGLTCLYFFLPRETLYYRHRPDVAR